MKEVTIGQYYQADSLIHRLDPRVKIIGTFFYMISLFVFNNIYCYALAAVFLLVVIALCKVPPFYMFNGMKAVLFLIIFTSVCNILFTPGEYLWQFGILHVSKPGIKNALFMMIRLTLLVVSASIMTLTTTPNRLTDGLESVFKPLKLIKVPVHEMAMMMSIALRFIPILSEETDKIVKAQTARGARFDSKKLTDRIKSLIPLIVPLFVSSFRRASDLALAMEARNYHGGEGRTKFKPLKYKARDIVSYILLVAYLAGSIVIGISQSPLMELLRNHS